MNREPPMTDTPEPQQNQGAPGREPAINLPGIILALLGLMVAVHLARVFVLNESSDAELIEWLAFIPFRFIVGQSDPSYWLPLLWTPFTHAFLHAGWEHLILNSVWLAIFGTPVAHRYGPVGVLVIFFLGAAIGALCFAVTEYSVFVPLVGASGGIAGLTGAACRFIFQPMIVARDPESGEQRVLGRQMAGLRELFTSRRALPFIIVWLVLNAAVPFLPILLGEQIGIAWQAHLGGFIVGLLVVPLFERGPAPQGEIAE